MKDSYYSSLFRRLFKRFSFIFPLCVLLTIFIIGFIFNYFISKNSIQVNFDNKLIFPNKEFILGTNSYGQSMLNLIFISSFNTLILAGIITLVNLVLGVLMGILWGYNSKLDYIMILIKNVFDNIPTAFFYIIMFVAFGSGFWSLLLIVVLFSWIPIACLIRNNLLLIRNKDYNKMSRLLKTSPFKIAINNYLPSLLPIIFNSIAISFPQIISLEVIFSHFGFSFSKNNISLGKLIFDSIANNSCFSHPYLFFIPFLTVLLINLCYFYIGKTISSVSNKEEENYD